MTLRLLRHGAVATLRIDNPASRNAMTRAMWDQLPALVAEVEADTAIAVLGVAGVEGQFSGGADIGEFPTAYGTPETAADSNLAIRRAVEALAGCTKPTVACIRGACVGGGVALALACDLRLCGAAARFAVTPVKLGLVYSQADTTRLIRAIGSGRARELLFSARLVTADEALRMGLVDRLWPEAEIDESFDTYLKALSVSSRPALRAMKQMVAAIEAGVGDDDPDLATLFEAQFQGADFAEGIAAFMARRPPRFTAP